jgi:hypothetical protein
MCFSSLTIVVIPVLQLTHDHLRTIFRQEGIEVPQDELAEKYRKTLGEEGELCQNTGIILGIIIHLPGLVNVYKKLWKITIFNGKINYKWPRAYENRSASPQKGG